MATYKAIEGVNIFFDLDGTLIDARPRLYALFQKLMPQSSLTFEEYWELKRNKIDHRQILKAKFDYSEEEFRKFENIWLASIEDGEWLDMDKPFAGVTEFLMDIKRDHFLYVITARQKKEAAILQLKRFGWEYLFRDVLVSTPKGDKSQVISSAVKTDKIDWVVGDTGKDIETGKKLGIKTAAVLSGFLNREMLISYKPDIIVDNILHLKFDNTFHE